MSTRIQCPVQNSSETEGEIALNTRTGLDTDTGYRHNTTNSETSTYAIYVFGRIHEGIISNK